MLSVHLLFPKSIPQIWKYRSLFQWPGHFKVLSLEMIKIWYYGFYMDPVPTIRLLYIWTHVPWSTCRVNMRWIAEDSYTSFSLDNAKYLSSHQNGAVFNYLTGQSSCVAGNTWIDYILLEKSGQRCSFIAQCHSTWIEHPFVIVN